MKKIYLLILFCLVGQMTWADIIVEPHSSFPKVFCKITNLKEFPDYQFFILKPNSRKKLKQLESEQEEFDINLTNLIAIDNPKKHRHYADFNFTHYWTGNELDSIMKANNPEKYIAKVVKYLKIKKIEVRRIHLEVQKTEFVYNDETKIQKGSITLENSLYGLISLLALLSFVVILRLKKV